MQKVSHEPFLFEGDERGVILFHSFTSIPVDVRVLGREISKLGYTVYGPVFSNHGGPIEDTLIDPRTWVEDGHKAVQKMLDMGCKSVACFGVSLGGIISHKLLIDNDHVVAGGSFCSPMIAGYFSTTPDDFWNRYKAQKEEEGWSESDINLYRQEIADGVDKVMIGLDDLKKEMRPEFEKVTKPVFIAQGGSDKTIDPDQAFELRDLYSRADVQFVWLEEGGHVLTVGKTRKPLFEQLEEFLSKVEF